MLDSVSSNLRKWPVLRSLSYGFRKLGAFIKPIMPRALFARSLIILLAPVALLQVVVIYVYMERYSELVTRRLASGVAGEIAFIISAKETVDTPEEFTQLIAATEREQGLIVTFGEHGPLPEQIQRRFFPLLSDTVGEQLTQNIHHPLWYNTEQWPSYAGIQVLLDDEIMHIKVRRSRILATNWHIFLVWMALTSLVFLGIAILFLRNQIRPIQRLAIAAEGFGKGRDVPDFKPSGATEVRNAAIAFIDMRNRLNRHITQRTDMLAGVSHDLRTPLTRMKLQLAMAGDSEDIDDMKKDVAEMERMLEGYLAFARGQTSEESVEISLAELAQEVSDDAARNGKTVEVRTPTDIHLSLRRQSFKRALTNLIDNATRHGTNVSISLWRRPNNWVEIAIDDNGPGIPKARYEEAFQPFHRLDESRNMDHGGSGLGLAIARDIVRSHGGEIEFQKSPLGGLRALVSLPT